MITTSNTTQHHSLNGGYSNDDINKLGNAIIYFANGITNLSKTKLLKLIYLADELSVKTYGLPIFNLKYKVWQAGPVTVDVYTELSGEPYLLKDFIQLNVMQQGECYVTAKQAFNDAEFSDNELNLLETVLTSYGNYSATKLVELCHRQNTLWYKIAKENGILELFEQRKLNTTDFEIELLDCIKDDSVKTSIYNDYINFLMFSKQFKA